MDSTSDRVPDRTGVGVIAGQGRVARLGPLTIVSSESAAGRPASTSAMEVLDALDVGADWSFATVAAALHTYVVTNDVAGVAAVLDRRPGDAQGDPVLFLFDQAIARIGGTDYRGQGRSGWTTALITASPVELRLNSAGWSAVSVGTDLRTGIVDGAGALLRVHLGAPPPAETSPTPMPPTPAPPSPPSGFPPSPTTAPPSGFPPPPTTAPPSGFPPPPTTAPPSGFPPPPTARPVPYGTASPAAPTDGAPWTGPTKGADVPDPFASPPPPATSPTGDPSEPESGD